MITLWTRLIASKLEVIEKVLRLENSKRIPTLTRVFEETGRDYQPLEAVK